jgi:hypothetical protein
MCSHYKPNQFPYCNNHTESKLPGAGKMLSFIKLSVTYIYQWVLMVKLIRGIPVVTTDRVIQEERSIF